MAVALGEWRGVGLVVEASFGSDKLLASVAIFVAALFYTNRISRNLILHPVLKHGPRSVTTKQGFWWKTIARIERNIRPNIGFGRCASLS